MNVSLPDPMKEWAESQALTGRYSNVSDYVRDLIRRDQVRSEKLVALGRFIDEAETGGVSSRSFAEILAEARQMARERGSPD